MARRLNGQPGTRVLLVGAVLFAHWLLIVSVAEQLASRAIDSAMAPRLTTVYVRQLALADPPRAPPVVAPAAAAVQPAARTSSRSTAVPTPLVETSPPGTALPPGDSAETEVAPAQPDQLAAVAQPESAPDPTPGADGADVPLMPDVAELADGSVDEPAFAWPASTRLSYVLTGNYRGEIHGSAQVEWINAEPRYQVNLDVTIGLPFAPLLSRQMRSDGLLGRAGLQPSRYDQRSKMAFQPPRITSLRFRDQQVSTDMGLALPLPTGGQGWPDGGDFQTSVQDSASQFVQLTFLFTTRPHLLAHGTTISFPLALPSRVADWRYQVGKAETLHTRFGALEAYRVHTAPGTDRRRDLLAEAWFAPQLAYLPVRIRIEQEADVFLDLMIREKPEIAAR